MVRLGGQGFGKKVVRKLVKKKSGEEVKHPILKCTPSVMIFVYHVNAHQREISAKKNLKNFACKMPISLESASIFP